MSKIELKSVPISNFNVNTNKDRVLKVFLDKNENIEFSLKIKEQHIIDSFIDALYIPNNADGEPSFVVEQNKTGISLKSNPDKHGVCYMLIDEITDLKMLFILKNFNRQYKKADVLARKLRCRMLRKYN